MIFKDREIFFLAELAREASSAVMRFYNSEMLRVDYKKDNSCITDADRVSHDILSEGLEKFFPGMHVLSEEGKDIAHEERKNWRLFWLLDPLDGTKEFISKNGEFTVNIALIEKNSPVFGLVSAPAKNLTYYAVKGGGAFRKKKGEDACVIRAGKGARKEKVVVRSRSHAGKFEDEIISGLGPVKTIYAGSSLKFCLVAEGSADVYIRSGPTMEWDTAAGQCVAEEAGAEVATIEGEALLYNKKSLLNPGFICAGAGLLK